MVVIDSWPLIAYDAIFRLLKIYIFPHMNLTIACVKGGPKGPKMGL